MEELLGAQALEVCAGGEDGEVMGDGHDSFAGVLAGEGGDPGEVALAYIGDVFSVEEAVVVVAEEVVEGGLVGVHDVVDAPVVVEEGEAVILFADSFFAVDGGVAEGGPLGLHEGEGALGAEVGRDEDDVGRDRSCVAHALAGHAGLRLAAWGDGGVAVTVADGVAFAKLAGEEFSFGVGAVVVEKIAEADVGGVGFLLLLQVVVGGFGVADEEEFGGPFHWGISVGRITLACCSSSLPFQEVLWSGVQAVRMPRVDMRVVGVVFSGWILSDVVFLGFEVVEVADPVFVVAGVPDFAWKLLADDEGVAAFDELKA